MKTAYLMSIASQSYLYGIEITYIYREFCTSVSLNRTFMELKSASVIVLLSWSASQSYLYGIEMCLGLESLPMTGSLNRTFMELKLYNASIVGIAGLVSIVPLWN